MDPNIVIPQEHSNTAIWIVLLIIVNLSTILGAIAKFIILIREKKGATEALQAVTSAVEDVSQSAEWAEGAKGAKAVKVKVAAAPKSPAAAKALDKALS